jgi:hypothetical protein
VSSESAPSAAPQTIAPLQSAPARRAGADAGAEARDAAPAAEPVAAAAPLFPADWCARAGSGDALREDTIYDIVEDYLDDARGAEQPIPFDDPKFGDWYSYLVQFTAAVLGCPSPEGESLELGAQGFGLGNTGAVGVARGFDAAHARGWIDAFVEAVSAELALTSDEAAALAQYLEQRAADAQCAARADAGAGCPAGAATP